MAVSVWRCYIGGRGYWSFFCSCFLFIIIYIKKLHTLRNFVQMCSDGVVQIKTPVKRDTFCKYYGKLKYFVFFLYFSLVH